MGKGRNNFLLYIRNDPTSTFTWGGAYAHTTGVIKGFIKNGFEVAFAGYVELPRSIQVQRIQLSVPRLPTAFFKRLAAGLRSPHAIERRLRKDPDFIYFRLCLNDLYPYRLAKKMKVPLVMEYNGSEVWIARKWSGSRNPLLHFSQLIENKLLNRSDAIVVVSEPMRKSLLQAGVEEGKILVNPNGFDEDLFSTAVEERRVREKWNIPRDAVVVGHVSSFAPFHGSRVLAESIKVLMREGFTEACFVFVGDGEEKSAVEEMLKEYVGRSVLFTGRVSPEEAASLMRACDILVASHVYRDEGEFFGSPTKLFEYMASGKAIIASAIGQMKEIIRNGENGLLMREGDYIELAGLIKELVRNQSLREKLGKNAKEEAFRHYSWTAHVKRTINFLEALRLI